MATISIKYADDKCAEVSRADVKALFKDKDIHILMGEGNFTFTVALAAIRGSWNGIVSTRYESEADADKPKPQFDEVREECIKSCSENGKLLGVDDSDVQKYIDAVQKLPPPPIAESSWKFGIDPLTVKGTVILFQCPWVPHNTTGTLITEFLRQVSTKQNAGDYVLIGIINAFSYVKDYNLRGLLGEDLSWPTDSSGKYDFLGADDTFIQEILKHGYRHQSCHGDAISTHKNIHVTLVFQKNSG